MRETIYADKRQFIIIWRINSITERASGARPGCLGTANFSAYGECIKPIGSILKLF